MIRDNARTATLLLLADGRFPTGSYAHSGGLEPAVVDGHVVGYTDFEAFLDGKIDTTGVLAAAFAAAACTAAGPADPERLGEIDAGLDARMPSPAQRAISRQLGRQLIRAVTAIYSDERLALAGHQPHRPAALGVAAAVLGLGPYAAALAALHDIAAGAVAAAIRLLALDPLEAYGALARRATRLDRLAADAAATAGDDVDSLPAPATPLLDVLAERHAARRGRLFTS